MLVGVAAARSVEIVSPGATHAALELTAAMVVGGVAGLVLPRVGVRWTWPPVLAPVVAGVWLLDPRAGALGAAFCLTATAIGWKASANERRAGGDLAARAATRPGPFSAVRGLLAGRLGRRALTDKGLLVGRDERNAPVRVPIGSRVSHTLVLGATGTGKTVTQSWILGRAIDAGHAVVCVDPKGDPLMLSELLAAAKRNGRELRLWTPEGPLSYNPFAHGSESELADKALASETYTEPHYLRQAQRYLAFAVRTIRGSGGPVSLAALVAALDPDGLDELSRPLPDDQGALVQAYLDSLTAEQKRGLAGTRDRLAILAESELGVWLGELPDGIDLGRELSAGNVVYFRLEADRWPLLAEMLAGAIVQDLVTLAARHQRDPARAVVCIDEFSAIAPDQVVRLFGRARSAGMSLLLGTQELADLQSAEHPGLLEQALANTATIVAHRQRVPDSAELIARVAGTRGAWTHTQRTQGIGLTREAGTRTRAREFHVHPDDLKTLRAGEAVVITDDGRAPQRTRMLHPREAAR